MTRLHRLTHRYTITAFKILLKIQTPETSMSISINTAFRHSLMILALFFFTSGVINTSHAMSPNEGTWVNKQYKINGAWEIEDRDGQTIIKFKDGFKTKGGPDLKVFLSKKDIKDITGKNATADGIFISKLKSKKGDQEYVLPQDIDIDDYASLLIHCEAFSVLWGGANI